MNLTDSFERMSESYWLSMALADSVRLIGLFNYLKMTKVRHVSARPSPPCSPSAPSEINHTGDLLYPVKYIASRYPNHLAALDITAFWEVFRICGWGNQGIKLFASRRVFGVIHDIHLTN